MEQNSIFFVDLESQKFTRKLKADKASKDIAKTNTDDK